MGQLTSTLALATLIAQNVSLVLMMRHSRQRVVATMYDPKSAVLIAELIKLLFSLLMMILDWIRLKKLSWPGRSAMFKILFPSTLYVFQNNLLYLALSNLDAFTFQVTYQLKIVTTALFSTWLLKRYISRQQWMSLFVLIVGVALVQVNTSNSKDSGNQSVATGFLAVVTAALTSGLAGVAFEKILKSSTRGSSLWSNNFALAFWGVLFSAYPLWNQLMHSPHSLLEGVDDFVWLIILNQALGGILVAVVVKLTDNIAKAFATSLSIVVGGLVQYYLYSIPLSDKFLLGASLVISATATYSFAGLPRATKPSQT